MGFRKRTNSKILSAPVSLLISVARDVVNRNACIAILEQRGALCSPSSSQKRQPAVTLSDIYAQYLSISGFAVKSADFRGAIS